MERQPSLDLLFKNIAKGSSLYAIAFMGQRLASLILIPITTRFLTPADYGVGDLVEQTVGVLSVLLGLYFSSSLGYFYFRADSNEERRTIVWTTVFGATAVGLVASAVCWPFAAPLSRLVFHSEMATGYLQVAFLALGPAFFLEGLFSWLRVSDRPVMFVVGSLIRVGMTIIGMVVLLTVFKLRVWGVLYSGLAAVAVTALVLAVYCIRIEKPTFNVPLFIRMGKFAAPIGLTASASFIINTGDRVILPHYGSFTDLGIYVLAYKLGMLISVAYSSFQIYWGAQAFQIMKRDDAQKVFARLFTYMLLGVSFCGLGVVVAARPALTVLAAPSFRGAAALVPLITAAYCVRSIGDFLRVLFVVEGRPGCEAVCTWLGAALCLAGYLILIPRYGIWGAAIATAAAFFALTAITAAWVYRLRPYRIEGARAVKIGIALIGGLFVHFVLPLDSPLHHQIGSAALSLAMLPLTLWVMRFPTGGELQAGRSGLASLARLVSRNPRQ